MVNLTPEEILHLPPNTVAAPSCYVNTTGLMGEGHELSGEQIRVLGSIEDVLKLVRKHRRKRFVPVQTLVWSKSVSIKVNEPKQYVRNVGLYRIHPTVTYVAFSAITGLSPSNHLYIDPAPAVIT